jgi:hypothetical protein
MGLGLAGRLTRRGRWLAIVSVASILGWAVPALLMLDKGFAVQDEGTYVLSYRFWHSNPYFVSGAQYFLGPVFEALGESIPLLRLVRLLMVLGANAWFGWTFVAWLSQARDGVLPSSRTSLVLLLTACGGMSYLWTPLTPGYYDLTADASLVLISLLLLTLVRAPRVAPWIPLVSGAVGVVLVITKWTAAPVLVLTLGVAGWVLVRREHRAAVRYAVLVVAGAVVALVVCQVFLVSLDRFASTMWRVSQLTTVASHSFTYLARTNVSSTLQLFVGAVVLGLVLLVGTVVARALSSRGRRSAAGAWLTGAAVLSTAVLPFALGWHGGDQRGRVMVGIAFGGLIAAVVAAVLSRPTFLPASSEDRWVVLVLLLVPLAQAAGTNVELPYVAGECLAAWSALVLVLAADGAGFPIGTSAVLVNLAVLVVATSMIAGSTTLRNPFKTTGIGEDTVHVSSLGVRLAPATARQYSALETALGPYIVRDRTPMITLDQKAGLTYLLGGVPAGSTWTDAVSPTRTAGILELACRNGDLSADRRPVLILDRPVDRHLVRAMQLCGFGTLDRYRRLSVPGGPSGLSVLVPD